jgi:malonyl-CoA O-methyltransferase
MQALVKPTFSQTQRINKHFGAASHSYDSASRLQRITGLTLFEMDSELFEGQILDLGCGTGLNTNLLCGPDVNVTGCDLALDMTLKTRVATGGKIACIQGDAEFLPFQNESFEVVYSNLMLQWIDDLTSPLKQIRRVLKPGGYLLFTTLLDGTLAELKSAWAKIDDDNHVNQFSALQSIEQSLASSGFEFTIEVESIELDYSDVTHLARELKYLGANYVKGRVNKGLMGRRKWAALAKNYQTYSKEAGKIPASYRVAYVKAWVKG